MIKFFRNIRKQLLGDGKTAKYFKYALGEIILVVLGILIALQINNWNEERKNHKTENQLLYSLKTELESSLEQLSDKIYATKNIKSWDSIIMRLIARENESISDDSLQFLIRGYVAPPTFDPEVGTISSILNSGKLSLISNQELRLKVSSWQSYYEEVIEVENLFTDFYFNEKRKYLRKYLPFRNRHSFAVGLSKYKFNSSQMYSSMEFENLIHQDYVYSILLYNRYNRLKTRFIEMLTIVKYELDSL